MALLEQSGLIFLDWIIRKELLNTTSQDYDLLRQHVGKIAEFYEKVVFAIVIKDIEYACQRYIKKLKRLVN